MNPAISIIVPVYNVEIYLEKCIESILNQTFTNFEIILVDDGSTDKSGEVCDGFAKKDNRIKVIHKKNGGLSSARNTGLEVAKGDYLGFVDSDDYINQYMFEKLYELCKKNNCDISICRFGRYDNDNLINKKIEEHITEFNNVEGIRQLFKGILYRFSVCNKLFKTTCFENILFPEGRIHEDLSTTYKLFARAQKVIYTNYIGYIYVKRENSILTNKYNKKRLDAFLGWKEIISFIKDNYPQVFNEVISGFVYWAIDNIFYILKQVESNQEKKEYLDKIHCYLNKYYKEIIRNNLLSLKYKTIIRLIHYNYRFLLVFSDVTKFMGK